MTFKAVKHPETALKQDAEYRGKIYDSIADTIGATPLVRGRPLEGSCDDAVAARLEDWGEG